MSIRIVKSTDTAAVDALLSPRHDDDAATRTAVVAIVEAVRKGGDEAVARYARQFDGLSGPAEIPRDQWTRGARQASREVRLAIATAARNIARVARAQVPRSFRVRVAPGVTVEQRVRPLDRVGCYVPGGRYPLPSSLLMTAIPARVAGVAEIIAVCPRPEPAVLAAADAAGVTRLFQLGGAHAIAALAFGTQAIPRVDRIVGPGNRYVAAAKTYVSAECGIDMQAGPSEILVLSDRGNPVWLAADLIAQAEHDPDARAILITSRAQLATAVAREVVRQMPASGPAREALARHGGVIVTRTPAEAVSLANRMAPEHLVVDDEKTAAAVGRAGAIFIGPHTAQVAGDYAIGSNHVLPTGGAARLRGGLHTADYVRVVSVQRVTAKGLRALGPTVRALALAEGLTAHAQSMIVRGV
ncbi:MAG: histidinol dehydrogenase [Vicinamibacteria bacterium]|nr:histidinol dehydrogenase [Vicinamibacteria bacterium]